MSLSFTYFPKTNINQSDYQNQKANFKKTIEEPQYGFFKLPGQTQLFDECQRVYKKFQGKKSFFHIGIGGSSLGTELIVESLKKYEEDIPEFIFVNNIDPDYLHQQINGVDLLNSVFFFCSKSGGTAETMASLAIFRNLLNELGVNDNELKNYFVFATDPSSSQLLDLGKQLSVETLCIPSNIGGRFSGLTSVGLLPALFAKINIEKLFEGAQFQAQQISDENENTLYEVGQYLYNLKKDGVTQTVLMPYSSKLKNFSFWFTQLWAESLGKEMDKSGQSVNTGLTPIPAYGATDQHSQMQLFMEGPYDKAVIFLEIQKNTQDFSLKNNFELKSLAKLAPYTLGTLMKAELEGTLSAMTEKKRPFIHLAVSELNEHTLGELIFFFESLTVLMGEYLNINPFDQPGVELGKINAQNWLDQNTGA
jgi:glucose-6-phosphate isomerase